MAIDTRLLTVISAINELGICSVLDLNRSTGISRPAIHRMIDNLCEHGYTEKVNGGSTIRLTSRILSLSAGYRPENRLAEVASPIFRELESRLRWPLTFASPMDDNMIILETTRDRNPFVFDNGRTGLRLPIISTAIGCAYLAFCPESERDAFLTRWEDCHIHEPGADAILVVARDRIEQARKRGYALRAGGIPERTTTVAVPVVISGMALGALCCTFPTSAVSLAEGIAQNVRELQAAAKNIGAKFEH